MSNRISLLALLCASISILWQVYQSGSFQKITGSQPRSAPPLDHTLAHVKSQLRGYNGASNLLTHSYIPTACGSNLSVYHTDPEVFADAGSPKRPILLLNHGYPESSYIWRRIAPEISKRVPVFIPDRPGYGLSTPCSTGDDQLTFAGSIIEAANAIYGSGVSVVLAGHDRGARTMQRAALSIEQFPSVNALGLWIADIVPIVVEYASFTDPAHSTGYFHWSFLPKGNLATDMIMAYGGGAFATYLNNLGKGINTTAAATFEADDSFAVYANFFDQHSVTNTSVWDYVAGATIDYQAEVADQAAGRKIKIPTHVEYSQYNLADLSGFNVHQVWSEWVDPDVKLTTEPVCCGQGHFIVESAPQETVEQLNRFLDQLGVLDK